MFFEEQVFNSSFQQWPANHASTVLALRRSPPPTSTCRAKTKACLAAHTAPGGGFVVNARRSSNGGGAELSLAMNSGSKQQQNWEAALSYWEKQDEATKSLVDNQKISLSFWGQDDQPLRYYQCSSTVTSEDASLASIYRLPRTSSNMSKLARLGPQAPKRLDGCSSIVSCNRQTSNRNKEGRRRLLFWGRNWGPKLVNTKSKFSAGINYLNRRTVLAYLIGLLLVVQTETVSSNPGRKCFCGV